ncbi:hypothetical protein ACWDTT_10585 [Streptosporangium sandarakinum]
MKAKLSGIVLDGVSGEVPVRFSTPDVEFGSMTYPIIIIERENISVASDREHRGWGRYGSPIEGAPERQDGDLWDYYGELPIPMDFDYKISTMCRTHAQQVALTGILSRGDRLPPRFGYLKLPVFNELVPLDLLGSEPLTMYDGDQKRLFTMHYLIRVQTEVLPHDPQRRELIRSIHGRITDTKTRKWNLGNFGDSQP